MPQHHHLALGLEPSAIRQEIEAASASRVRAQDQRAVHTNRSAAMIDAFERAVWSITVASTALLAELPARRQPPPTLPPLRRIAAR